MTSRELLAVPMVATIFVRRIGPLSTYAAENSSRNGDLFLEVVANPHHLEQSAVARAHLQR